MENRFFYTNLDRCHFSWRLTHAASHPDGTAGDVTAPGIRPGETGTLQLNLHQHWQEYDILSLTAKDPDGRELYTWTFPISRPARIARRMVDTASGSPATARQTDSLFTLNANDVTASFGAKTGLLRAIQNAKGPIPFNNGPVITSGDVIPSQMTQRAEGNNQVLEVSYPKGSLCQSLKWTMYPSGWLKMDLKYYPTEYDYSLLGASFSYPEKGPGSLDSVKGVRWLGDGPYRVWKNRTQGVTLDIWDKAYNNTITGQGNVVYPEFKGYYSNFYWMRLETAGQPFTIVCADEDVYLRLFTPANPVKTYNVAPPFPSGDISFMHAIPPIGTKSQKPENMGPSGNKNMYYDYTRSKDYSKPLTLYFDFSGK